MCGRFTRFASWQEVHDTLRGFLDTPATPPNDYRQSYNVAPTQGVLTLARHQDGNRTSMMRWGLVPFWAKEILKGSLFNARSETVADKPSFRTGWKHGRRCLVIADGYYEWHTKTGIKQPYRIHLPDNEVFCFAGLWEHNDSLDITSCAILTTDAAPNIAHLHPRMPIILPQASFQRWLGGETTPANATDLMCTTLAAKLTAYPVSRAVGNVRINAAELIEPAAASEHWNWRYRQDTSGHGY